MKTRTSVAVAAGILCILCSQVVIAEGLGVSDLRTRVVSRLQTEGKWPTTVADAYWRVNQRKLEATESVAPELVEKEIHLLASSATTAKVLRFIEEEPEASSLVLLSFDRDGLASAVLDAPREDRGMLTASYFPRTDPGEIDKWTAAVKRHPRIIATFQRRCAALPYQGIFGYRSTMEVPEAQEIYARWLDEILEPSVIAQSDETLSSRFNFVAEAGRGLRIRLESDPSFRQKFLPTIWPQFHDSVLQISREHGGHADLFYLFNSEPLIWEFFQRKDAPTLFRNAGMDAITMLCGDHALKPALRQAAVPLWAKGILDLPRCMLNYQGNSAFCTLVDKTAGDSSLLNAVCLRLEEKGVNWPQEASAIAGLSPQVLRKELRPKGPSAIPGASIWSIVEKTFDGRRVGFGDLMGAGVDVFDLGCLVVTMGGAEVEIAGRKAAQQALTQTLRSGATESMEKVVGRTIKEMENDVLRDLERKALAGSLTEAENVALTNLKKGAAREEWTQVLFKRACEQLPQSIRQKIVDVGCVEITTPVKEGFKVTKNLGIGGESFSAWTGLEPRLFMRQDGRVFINFINVATRPSPAISFLTRTIENGTLQSAPSHELAKGAAGFLHQWQEDVSAWWSGHATGQFPR